MTSVSNLRAQFDDPDPVKKQSAARNAALRGALSAFPKQAKIPQTDPSSTALRDQANARSAANVVAGRHAPAPAAGGIKPPQTSSASLGAVRAHKRSQDALHSDAQRRSIGSDQTRSDSPSNVAAVIAAARFSEQNPAGLTRSGSPHYMHHKSNLRSVSNEQIPEEEQIPAHGTVHDVRRWLSGLEDKERSPPAPRTLAGISADTNSGAGLHKGHRSFLGQDFDGQGEFEHRSLPKIVSPRPMRAISVTDSLEAKTQRDFALQDASKPKLELLTETATSPAMRAGNESPPSAYHDAEELPQLTGQASIRTLQDEVAVKHAKSKPTPPPPRRAQTQASLPRASSRSRPATSQDGLRSIQARRRSLNSASPVGRTGDEPLPGAMPKRGDQSQRPSLSLPITSRKITPHMTGDSLANAIVASSLASSRAPSPTKSPGPPLHSKSNDKSRLQLPFRHKDLESRTPSPAKGMRHTLRKPNSSSDDDDRAPNKSSRKFFIRKHPHKHHEGDRKRWRTELTELERKRYDGLWAANKGLYIETDVLEDLDGVSGLVVRDIWRRSRLPDHVLEEVWDLVDTDNKGRLTRAEFVAGLWLVDQRLKGRKLPTRVQPSIWTSARGIHGLKVRKYK